MEFKEKLDKLTKLNRERSGQLERNKKIWIKEVNTLYKTIEEWFDEYIQKGRIIIDFEKLQYAECEEFFLETHIMLLNFGGEQGLTVIVEPTGINIAGALGKIDIYFRGHKDESFFLLLIEDDLENFHWEIRINKKSQTDLIKFTKESFENILNECLDKWTDI
ncbi:hypothetical protein QUF90_18300 [Desulfococcaceae bacterium HSG9]|nr:hypothetical protein [Desulfococcaceae bacterium HSG9]